MEVALRDPSASWSTAAREYLERGSAVRVVPGADVRVTAGPADPGEWALTDAAGSPLSDSEWIRAAVAGHAEAVRVQLRDGDRVLAEGRTDVRRTTAGTVTVALSCAGALIEMAVAGAVPTRSAVDQSPGRVPGPWWTSARAHTSFAGRLSRAVITYRQWGVARLPGPAALDRLLTGSGPQGPVVWSSPPPEQFWADPVVVGDGDRAWLFVEELERRTGRGRIRALQWDGRELRPGRIVYATDHHMSYPQVQRVAGRWLATVETCAAHNPILTFDELGGDWRPAVDLPPLPAHMADPVVDFDDTGHPHRLLATDARTSPDAVFVAHRWLGGRWERDPAATYVDVSTARGGGTWDPGRGLRAVQDCASLYGRGLAIVPDAGWYGRAYGAPLAEVHAADLTTNWRHPDGVHTLTWTSDEGQVWLDGWRRRPQVRGGYFRWVERRHQAECTG